MATTVALFEGNRVKVFFESARLKKGKDGKKTATMNFTMPISGSLIEYTPMFVQQAFLAMGDKAGSIARAELDKIVKGQNIRLYTLPDSKSVAISLMNVDASDIVVDRNEGLCFSVEAPLSTELGKQIAEHFSNPMFATFEAAQPELKITISEGSVQ